LLFLSNAIAQQDPLADVKIGELIRLSPDAGDLEGCTAHLKSLQAHIEGLDGGPSHVMKFKFLLWYWQYISIMMRNDGVCFLAYYNPERQNRSQIDHDLEIFRKYISPNCSNEQISTMKSITLWNW
jgi:hypothetical protein